MNSNNLDPLGRTIQQLDHEIAGLKNQLLEQSIQQTQQKMAGEQSHFAQSMRKGDALIELATINHTQHLLTNTLFAMLKYEMYKNSVLTELMNPQNQVINEIADQEPDQIQFKTTTFSQEKIEAIIESKFVDLQENVVLKLKQELAEFLIMPANQIQVDDKKMLSKLFSRLSDMVKAKQKEQLADDKSKNILLTKMLINQNGLTKLVAHLKEVWAPQNEKDKSLQDVLEIKKVEYKKEKGDMGIQNIIDAALYDIKKDILHPKK